MRRRGIEVEKGGWEKRTRERESMCVCVCVSVLCVCAIKVNGRSQEHATFTHRVHLNVCITSSRVFSRIFPPRLSSLVRLFFRRNPTTFLSSQLSEV